jgi:hypothetical protein
MACLLIVRRDTSLWRKLILMSREFKIGKAARCCSSYVMVHEIGSGFEGQGIRTLVGKYCLTVRKLVVLRFKKGTLI